jgi:hypothetical protein
MFYQAKQDGKLQLIIDYQALNALTVRDIYPLPLIGSIINKLQGKTLFSKVDLRWGFNNIQIKEEDHWKAAFKTPFGAYETNVMLFGLTNSPPHFLLSHGMNVPPPYAQISHRIICVCG